MTHKKRPTPAEFTREATRVLPHLQPRNRTLVALAHGGYGILGARGNSQRVLVQVDARIVDELLRAGLIEPSPSGESFVLSRIGTAFLTRAKALEDPFAAQHRVLVPLRKPRGGKGNEPDVNAAESPLAWLKTRKNADGHFFLSEPEFLAGERLRHDFTLALMTPKSTTSWPLERVDHSRRAEFSPIYESERVNAARKRFWSALDAVGPELAPSLVGVCCHLQGLETIEAKLDLPKRSCKTVLKLGLGRLARHYGLIRDQKERSVIRAKSFGILPGE